MLLVISGLVKKSAYLGRYRRRPSCLKDPLSKNAPPPCHTWSRNLEAREGLNRVGSLKEVTRASLVKMILRISSLSNTEPTRAHKKRAHRWSRLRGLDSKVVSVIRRGGAHQ